MTVTLIDAPLSTSSGFASSVRAQWAGLAGDELTTVHRAATINLIATTTGQHEAGLREVLDDVIERLPCRAFFLVIDRGTTLSARYWVGGRSTAKARDVVCERITIHAAPDDVERMLSLVRPLLLTDLPCVLYTHGPLPECELEPLRRIAALADVHVFDSSMVGDATRDLERLRSLTGDHRDLAWLRLAPWRRALARAFERFEWRADQPTRVVIERSQATGALAAATLLSGWLHERLGAGVELTDAAAPDCEPARLELRNGGATVELVRCVASARIRTRITLEDRCSLPCDTPASRGSRGALLAAVADMI